ncbi:MAG: OmpH family outer membrane protein [Paludibacteraceae bacterium]|nr:OmpH family outer membrane protein [Prevotella sp.]MBQ3929875.1 OmpH family outer membrane protein [Paludibacteraceae bacterium]
MNKKNFFKTLAIAAVTTLFVACDKQNDPAPQQKADGKATAVAGQKIAFIHMDSIASQYEFYKDMQKELEQKGKNIQTQLSSQQQQLQNDAQKFEADIKANRITSQEQGQRTQANLQQRAQQLDQTSARLQQEFNDEQAKFLQALQDSITHFLADYNKDKKYAFILQDNNVLYADETYDITKEVIAGLNKAYKKK